MKKAFYWIPLSILLGLLAVLAACGGDDDSDGTSTATDGATSPSGTSGADGTPIETPVPTEEGTPPPAIGRDCETDPDSEGGLISYLEFATGTNLFDTGEDIEMKLVLKNCSISAVLLNYDTEARYDFSVQNSDEEEVWRWSDEQDLADEPGEESIQPQEVVEYDVTWDQLNTDGEQVEPGTYKISAFSLGCAEEASDCHFGPVELVQIAEES